MRNLPLEVGEQRLVAEHEPRIEQRRADGHVGVREPHALVDGAGRMPDLEAEIPEQIEHVFGDALAPGGLLVGKQEQEIDIRPRRQHAAPIAPLRHDGHALGGGGDLGGIDMVGDEVVGEPDERVLKGAQALGASPAVAVALKLTLGCRARVVDELPEALHKRRAKRGILAGIRMGKPCRLLAHRVEVEIGRGLDERLVHLNGL